jgi:hypothetical protein
LQQHIGAMAEMYPPHLVLGIHFWIISRVIPKSCFAQQIETVDLLNLLTPILYF